MDSSTERLCRQIALRVDEGEPLDRQHVIRAQENVHHSNLTLPDRLIHHSQGKHTLVVHIHHNRRRKEVVRLSAAHVQTVVMVSNSKRKPTYRCPAKSASARLQQHHMIPELALENTVGNFVDGLFEGLGLVAYAHMLNPYDHAVCTITALRLDAACVPDGRNDVPRAIF
jgi:hypothetical protein